MSLPSSQTSSITPPTVVLDSSAALAWLLSEAGGDVVEAALPAAISAINLTELVIVAVRRGLPGADVSNALAALPLTVLPFEQADIQATALLHASTRQHGLSLADCICLTAGVTLGLPVLTADRRWAEVALPIRVQLIR